MSKLLAAISASLAAGIVGVQPQTFPSKPITLIVPFPPGGSTDVAARIVGERMRQVLGQPVIIEKAGGAGGSIGVGRLARSTPDGHTIDIGQWDTHIANGVVYALNYDLQKDFEHIGLLSVNPQLLLGRKAFPADDLKDLVAWMKANPGKATIANQNASAEMVAVLMQQLTGTSLLMVPYRGAGPAMQDVIAGHIDLIVAQAAVSLPQVRAGTIKPFANLSPARSSVVPDIPIVDEGGVPGLYVSGWFGLFAPKGTPKDVIANLNAAMLQSLADPAR